MPIGAARASVTRQGAAAVSAALLGDIAGLLFEADAAVSQITYSSGSNIAQINDLSGNDNHAVQATTAEQPDDNSGVINGRASLGYDGDDFLVIPFALPDVDTGGTLVNVVQFSTIAQYLWCGRYSGSPEGLSLRIASGGQWRVASSDGVTFEFGPTGLGSASANTPYVVICWWNSTNVNLRIDNAEDTSTHPFSSFNQPGDVLWGARGMLGADELVGLSPFLAIFDHDLNLSDRNTVASRLLGRFKP